MKRRMLIYLSCISFLSLNVSALIFYSTGDPAFNTNAPSGSLAHSAWAYQGLWRGGLGTAIARECFITAEHLGGSVGDKFTFDGNEYITAAVFDDPQTDLRIWRVDRAFSRFATINSTNTEVGANVVAIGRGTRRGDPVTTRSTNFFGSVTVKDHGWLWGEHDGVIRWGENKVDTIVDGKRLMGYDGIGDLLQCGFTPAGTAGTNECHVSTGDSGGALFVRDGNNWHLAGIIYASEGIYNTENSGQGFLAAIYDKGGLYQAQGTNWLRTPDLPFEQSGAFYATRISSRAEWIRSVINTPTVQETLWVESAIDAIGPFLEITASVDVQNRLIALPMPVGQQFYRLRSVTTPPRRITSIRAQADQIVLAYE
jgi:hypothetical protein